MPVSHQDDLRALSLFADMGEDAFERLLRAAYLQTFPPQIELIAEGDPADFLHIVVDGTVELFSTWNRRETTMALVRPVSTFILAASVRDAPYLMSARTLEKSRIVLLPSQDVRIAFEADAAFARAILHDLAQCYRSAIKNTKDLKLRTSLERLANYLIRQQDAQGGASRFSLPTDKRLLASRLGMTPENLSRAFRSLAAYGVTVDGSRISIADRSDLERFARPNPLIDDYAT